ncbi:g11202 [Coccomyxa elongata]
MLSGIRNWLRPVNGRKLTTLILPPWAPALGAVVAVILYCVLLFSPPPSSTFNLRLPGVATKRSVETHWAQNPLPFLAQPTNYVNAASRPQVLEHLFVCVTFHWDVLSLTLLRQVLTTIAHYPTNVTMCIISNRPELLQLAIKHWAVGADQWVCGTDEVLSNPLHLAFVHRAYMERAFSVPVYTSFMYLEHDMSVTWTALLGWAEDFPILEPLGFQRGFYRVEPSEQTGLPGLTDQISRININQYDLKLNVSTLDNDGLIKVRHFMQLPNPYFAAWIAGRTQMAKFLSSAQWDKRSEPWAVRAMAACGLQFVDVPKGFFSAAVVPYDPGDPPEVPPALDPHAAIEHLSNKYCSANTYEGASIDPADHPDNAGALHCTIPVHSFLHAA